MATTTYSLDQLQQMAGEHFARLGVNKLFATSDGQFFLLENRARLHAGKKGSVYPIENAGGESATQEAPSKSIAEIKAALEGADLPTLQTMLHEEVAGANRKGAVAAIQKALDAMGQ